MNTENRKYIVTPSPHVHSPESIRSCMFDVILALLPAIILGIYFFGWRVFFLTLISVTACIVFEFFFQMFAHRPQTVMDLSAIVTGMLVAMTVPAHVPYWMVIVADFMAIVIAKQLFGGLGSNFMNPALCGRVFLFSWASWFSVYPATGDLGSGASLPIIGDVSLVNGVPDIISSATPLASMKQGYLPADYSLRDMFLGNMSGSVGEVSAFILLIGGIYLVMRGIISVRIPLTYIGTVALMYFIFPAGAGSRLSWALYGILSGGLMLGAIFMATDYATSPVTAKGQIVFGIGCGLLTYVIRRYGSYNEGVAFAILIMNTLVWAIDKACAPRHFGAISKKLFQRRTREVKKVETI